MSQVQEYWLPGYGLSRSIVLGHLQYFLGPSASVRPYSMQGREGYLIVGVPLTRTQVEDLKTLSQEYERQSALRMTSTSPTGSTDRRSPEPYINQIVPVGSPSERRRRQPEYTNRRSR